MPEYSISQVDKFDDQHPGQVVEEKRKKRRRRLILDFYTLFQNVPGKEGRREGEGAEEERWLQGELTLSRFFDNFEPHMIEEVRNVDYLPKM